MKNSLNVSGLSMSQAQSVSNLCNQRALEINNILEGINNASKTVKIGNETYDETVGKPLPANIVEIILEKGKLYGTVAFLMENIKAKDSLLKEISSRKFTHNLIAPLQESYMECHLQANVEESWGWNQLPLSEINEYREQETLAAHIGLFIHNGKQLDRLRNDLPKIKTLQFITVKDGEKTPVKVSLHHTSSQLMSLHESLSALHRKYESRVNYFKAKVKNLVTIENARVDQENGVLIAETNKANNHAYADYLKEIKVMEGDIQILKNAFEQQKNEDTKATAGLRIFVDPRFKETIDMFLTVE